jgi:hypothetical protein
MSILKAFLRDMRDVLPETTVEVANAINETMFAVIQAVVTRANRVTDGLNEVMLDGDEETADAEAEARDVN